MSKIERGFYPLSQIEEQGVPKIEMNLNLPEYVDKDQIGVNIKGIHQMMRLGGIKTLHVAGQAGETSSYIPDIVGRDENGTAMAGKRGIEKKVPKYLATNNESDYVENIPFPGRWTDAQVIVNLSEITTTLSEKHKLRSAKAWTGELNNALKQGVLKGGQAHLIFGPVISEYFNAATGYGVGAYLGVGDYDYHGLDFTSPVAGSLFWTGTTHAAINIGERIRHKILKGEESFRWSLFNGPQLDRAVALKVMAKTRTLVKEMSSDGREK